MKRIDPSGLRPISFGFNAFIHGRMGRWLPEPGGSGWEFESDGRGFGGGSARISSNGEIESTEIGYVCDSKIVTHGGSGSTRREAIPGVPGAYHYEFKKAAVAFSNRVESRAVALTQHCSTEVPLDAHAGYPFVPVAPHIDYRARFIFEVVAKDTIKVTIRGAHDAFPNFEALLDGKGRSPTDPGGAVYEYDTPYSGPGFWNLGGDPEVSFGSIVRYISAPAMCCPNPGKWCDAENSGIVPASETIEWWDSPAPTA